MSALFSIIPQALFGPLASPGAEVYADVLLALVAGAQRHHLPLSRELAHSIIAERLAHPEALALTEDAGTDETAPEAAADDGDIVQARASAILRYLTRCGWLRGETQSDFTQAYIIPDYAFRILCLFQEIVKDEPPPLRGLICSIHDMLVAAVRDGNADVRLPEAHRQTAHLLNALKQLQHNIGLHVERVLQERDAREVLEHIFSSYRAEVVDRAYHQLRTTDHVSRYRPGVVAAASQLERAGEIERAARRMFERREEPSIEDAARALAERVREVREHFEALDRLLQVIDTRHSQFVDSAVRAIELQLAASTTSSGQLHAVLSHILDEEAARGDDEFERVTAPLVSLFEIGFTDGGSLAPPSRAPVPFEPEVEEVPALSAAEEEAERDKTLQHLLRAVTRGRVRRFAHSLLAGREFVTGAEIPLDGPEDLPLLIYLRAYGDGSLGYIAEEPPRAAWLEREGIGFRDFMIRKKNDGEAA